MRPGQGVIVLPRIQSNVLKNCVFPGEIACPFVPAEKALAATSGDLRITIGNDSVEVSSPSTISSSPSELDTIDLSYDGTDKTDVTVQYYDGTDWQNVENVEAEENTPYFTVEAPEDDSTAAGDYTITVNGNGDSTLSSTYYLKYTVAQAEIANVDVALSATSAVAGAVVAPEPVLSINGMSIPTEGTVSFFSDSSMTESVVDIAKAQAGTYYAKVTFDGDGNIESGDTTEPLPFTVTNVQDPATSFANGTAVVKDLEGSVLTADKGGVYNLEYTGQEQRIVVESFTPEGAETLDSEDYTVTYAKQGSGNIGDPRDIKEPGTYTATITVTNEKSAYYKQFKTLNFVIANSKLSGAVAYEGDDLSDTTFVWSGETALTINFKIGDVKLVSGTDYKSNVAWYQQDGKSETGTDADEGGAASKGAQPVAPGTYYAKLTGAGTYNGSTYYVPVTIAKVDLATAKLTAADVASNGALPAVKIGDLNLTDDYGTNVTIVNGNQTGWVNDEKGTYELTVTAVEDDPYFVNSGKVSFNLVGALIDEEQVRYGSNYDELKNVVDGKTFNLSSEDNFDASKVVIAKEKASDSTYDKNDEYYAASDYSVKVYDQKTGAEVQTWNATGDYTVVVAMNVPSDYSVGGSFSYNFSVKGGDLSTAKIFVSYKGEVVNAINDAVYDGTDVMDDITVTVLDGKTALTEGEDYELVLTKGGKEVESAVDAGSYTLTVKGKAYVGSATFDINIKAATITKLMVQGYAAGSSEIAYTGEVVTPTILFTTDKDAAAKDNDEIAWETLSPDYYYLSGYKYAKDGKVPSLQPIKANEVKESGLYQVTVNEGSKLTNYDFASSSVGQNLQFSIVTAIEFVDVPADAWYADEVALASSNGYNYMNGIPNTKLFMPEGNITRAQVAQVLFNMAGGKNDQTGTYPSKFADTDPTAWYALPVLWASEAGIVTGYGEPVVFEPNGNVTREQAATMLYRYMQAQGKAQAAEADLSDYADGAQVSDWAAEAMQWAVANEVFGVNTDELRPQGDLTRAEMAAIAVRVQPDGAIKLVSE